MRGSSQGVQQIPASNVKITVEEKRPVHQHQRLDDRKIARLEDASRGEIADPCMAKIVLDPPPPKAPRQIAKHRGDGDERRLTACAARLDVDLMRERRGTGGHAALALTERCGCSRPGQHQIKHRRRVKRRNRPVVGTRKAEPPGAGPWTKKNIAGGTSKARGSAASRSSDAETPGDGRATPAAERRHGWPSKGATVSGDPGDQAPGRTAAKPPAKLAQTRPHEPKKRQGRTASRDSSPGAGVPAPTVGDRGGCWLKETPEIRLCARGGWRARPNYCTRIGRSSPKSFEPPPRRQPRQPRRPRAWIGRDRRASGRWSVRKTNRRR